MIMTSQRVLMVTRTIVSASLLLLPLTAALGQVSPSEVLNPRARANEQKYLLKLQSLHQAISATKFPSSFKLARYLNAKPGQRAATDPNGIEFVSFRSRIVLKISGLYNPGFATNELSENQRAVRTFQEAIAPILRLVMKQVSPANDVDAIGFEIVYDSRGVGDVYDLDKKEVITIVLSRDEAFSFVNASTDLDRQELLNRADIFVNGKEFGLALNQREPLSLEAMERTPQRPSSDKEPSDHATTTHAVFTPDSARSPSTSSDRPIVNQESYPSFADAMRLQKKYQDQTEAIMKEDGARLHLEVDTEPSFEIQRDQIVLRVTLRNPSYFEKNTSSIYKRAAQTFDLFLAPELRALSRELPADEELDVIDFAVLNRFGVDSKSTESIDFISPPASVRSFVQNKITSQELINQSTVLVDGVRVGLTLQLVE